MLRGNESVTIIRRIADGVDDYNMPVYTTEEIVIDGVLIAVSTGSSTDDVNRTPIDDSVSLYFPYGTAIEDGDVFEFRGMTWEKNGSAAVYPMVDGFVPGVVVTVRLRRG